MYVYRYIVYTYPYLAQLFPRDHLTIMTMPSSSPLRHFYPYVYIHIYILAATQLRMTIMTITSY